MIIIEFYFIKICEVTNSYVGGICRVGNRSKVGRSCDLKCRSSDAINKHVIIDETL
jgi:hypothetical protein